MGLDGVFAVIFFVVAGMVCLLVATLSIYGIIKTGSNDSLYFVVTLALSVLAIFCIIRAMIKLISGV